MENSRTPNNLKSNYDLLLEHLDQDSLAATLVTAHVNRGGAGSAEAMRQVLKDRIATLKAAYVERTDQ